MSLTASVAGVLVNIQSLSRPDTIDQATICTITVIDTAGTAFYKRGQPIVITDSILGTIFTGYIHNPVMTLLYPNLAKSWTMDCVQRGDYLSAKRTSNKIYNNQYAGTVVVDQVQRYGASEGLLANAALGWDELQTDWAGGTLSGTVAATNVSTGNPGAGDLELSLAGVQDVINVATATDFNAGVYTGTALVNGVVQPVSTPAIKMVANCTLNNAGNLYTYVKIYNGPFVLGTGYYFVYDVWIDPASPEAKLGFDILFSDGTTLRDSSQYNDAQNIPPHPQNDLAGLATGQWYTRRFWLTNYSGKTISNVLLVCEGDKVGVYTGWFKNVRITDASSVLKLTIFSTTLLTKQQMQTSGYASTTLTVVNTYAIPLYSLQGAGSTLWSGTNVLWASQAYSVDSVKILQSSFLSYNAIIPVGTLLSVRYSLDYATGTIESICTNNAPLTSLPAGLSLAGRTLTLLVYFYRDPAASPLASPEVTATLTSMKLTLNPAYAMASKTDIQFAAIASADWTQVGTVLTNTASTLFPNVLTLAGYVNNFDNGYGNNNLYSGGPAGGFGVTLNNRTLALTVFGVFDSRVELLDPGIYQNFTAEFDVYVQAPAVCTSGFVYRTTGWSNPNNTYAYSVTINTTTLQLAKGTNTATGAGTFTSISSVSVVLTSGNWHRIKIVVNGSNHQVSLDDILLINATDATWTAAGNIGFRNVNGGSASVTAYFDNFGIVPALTGTWVSPAIALTSAATYGTSIVVWRDESEDATNCTVLVEASVNNGATYFTCANGAPLPVLTLNQALAGVSLKMRITLTTTTASSMPGLDRFVVRVLQAFSATGTRISPALSLAGVGRADTALVNWNATTPALTSLAVATSIDSGASYQSVATPGAAIANISTQPDPVEDVFAVNSSANYTQGAFGGTPTPLTLYGTNVAATTVTTACKLATALGGTEVTVLTTAPNDGTQNYMEVLSQAGTSTDSASLPAPSFKGWFLDSNLLDNQTIPAGNWSATVGLDDSAGTFSNIGMFLRFGKRSSAGVVTPIGTLTLVSQALVVSRTTYTYIATSQIAMAFAVGDRLYIDKILKPAGAGTWGADTVHIYVSSNGSAGVANDLQINTPGYAPTSSGAWTWDTTNSRLIGSASVNGTLTTLAALTFADNQTSAVLDQADGSGLLSNYAVSASGYYIQIWDSAGTGTQNSVKLFRRVSSVNTQVGTTATISFTRGTPHLFVLDVKAGVIVVSMDGASIITYTDTSPLSAGLSGILLNTLARVYSLRIQQYGQNVSALSLLTKLTLTSTSPTATPQVSDMQAMVSSPDIGAGILMSSKAYQRTFLDANIADLTTQSNYWMTWRNDNSVIFQPRKATAAPFVLSSLNSQIIGGNVINDILVNSAELDNSGDLYRNRQIMLGCIATATFTEIKTGDGSATSWSVANPLTAPPISIILNGQSKTFGVKGVDTGKSFYYQIGSTAITQDSSQVVLTASDSFSIVYTGSFSQDVQRDNTSMSGTITQSMMATLENSSGGSSSGIVEAVLDLSSTPTTVAAATVQADQLLQRFGNIGRTFKCKTLRSGLTPGMQVSLFVPEFGLNNVQMLLTGIDVSIDIAPGVSGGLLYTWALTLQEGPNLGNWVQLFMNAFS